jgi:hypothetical protein
MSHPVPFDVFLAETAAARPEQFAAALQAAARQAGVSPEVARAEFERMKEHILSYYQEVQPVGSFLDADGQTIDCVPFEQQPSVRTAIAEGHAVARTAPPPPRLAGKHSHGPRPQPAMPLICPDGAVPIVRLTLERLLRFGTLDNYFHKTPTTPGVP